MAKIFPPIVERSIVENYGASSLVLQMVGKANNLISFANSGGSGTYRGGNSGSIGNSFRGWMTSPQNFKSSSLLQSLGATTGFRTNGSNGLPNSQPPSGIPTPLLDLLLQRPTR